MNDSSPRVLAILPAFIPSTQICVVKPLLRLHQAKKVRFRVNLESKVGPLDVCRADLVVLCRNVDPRYAFIRTSLLKNKIPYIFDLDDNFYEIPTNSEIGRYHRHPDRLAMLSQYLESASFVRVYSTPLANRVREINRAVEMVPGPIDMSIIQHPNRQHNHGKLKIVFATSRFNDESASIFTSPLRPILDRYDNKVEMHFWGTITPPLKGRRGVIHHRFTRNYDKFMRRFSSMGFDMGLTPLKNDLFHRSKTNNKYREYGACRIAGICSDVGPYSECVVDGETGLLIANRDEAWYDAMAHLIKDRSLREKIRNQAQEEVQMKYG